jgi:hypothetical protein
LRARADAALEAPGWPTPFISLVCSMMLQAKRQHDPWLTTSRIKDDFALNQGLLKQA